MADARLTPTLRLADSGDSRRVWEWRNDPVTRQVSGSTDSVPWDVHDSWFHRVLEDPTRYLLILEVAGDAMGALRFDPAGESGAWLVSINLAPPARGRGLATPVLEAGWEWLSAAAHVTRVGADIRAENERSVRAFVRAGFRREHESDGWLHYARTVDEEPSQAAGAR